MKDSLDLHSAMWMMKWSWILLMVPLVVSNSTTSTTYWWLGRAAFGGRNYNLEDIANNVHNQEEVHQEFPSIDQSDTDSEYIFDFLNDSEEVVKNSENMAHKPNVEILVSTTTAPAPSKKKKLKRVKNRGKRQTSDRNNIRGKRQINGGNNLARKRQTSDGNNLWGKRQTNGGNELRLDEIETECPVTLTCTVRRACDTQGIFRRDLIPCLHQTTGRIEVCCDKFIPSVCPEVRKAPPRENCEGELDECDNVGSFCSDNHLCCFNGCKNICLEDPPLKVDTSFFFRSRAIISRGEPKRPSDDDEEDYDYNESPNELTEDDKDISFFKEPSDLTREITIPVALVEKISELLTILKNEEQQNSPLIDQINLILSSVENKPNPRKPRLINTRTSRPPRKNRISRRRGEV